MPVIVTKAQVNKGGWQTLRKNYPELEASGVGKALEAFKADYLIGGKALHEKGSAVWNGALKKSLVVHKALTEAKKKAQAIKDAPKKKGALEVVTAFETVVQKFNDEILSLENVKKNREAFGEALTFPKVVGDGALLKAFYSHCQGEHSLPQAEAAVGWHAQKYKEMTLKYGVDGDWNQDAVVTKELLDHYSGVKPLSPPALTSALSKVTSGFMEMVTGQAGSLFARFKKSKALDTYLQAKFPAP